MPQFLSFYKSKELNYFWHLRYQRLLKSDGSGKLVDGYVGKLPTVNPLDLPYFMWATVGEYSYGTTVELRLRAECL